MNGSFLGYRRLRYLKVAAVASALATLAYIVLRPPGGASGGSALGYSFGVSGAALIVTLMAFGVRKRTYGAGVTTLVGWLSAHVYLGLALVVIVTLHTGFRFGVNVHTLAYSLVLLVAASGILGVQLYRRVPDQMAGNRRGEPLASVLARIAEVDAEAREAAKRLPTQVANVVLSASQNTRIGGGWWRQLSGVDPEDADRRALEEVRRLTQGASGAAAGDSEKLLALLGTKRELMERARRDIHYRALVKIWLFAHVPLSFALLAALAAHVVAVLFYS